MNKKIIVIDGYLAAGKSTFAVKLSKELSIPYIVKDTFKTSLCNSIGIDSREEGSRYSAVAFDGIMYIAERLMETSYPFLIEGNFVPAGLKITDEAGVIKALIDRYGYKSLAFMFTGDTQVFYKRYIEREHSAERGYANRDFEEISYENFRNYCHNLDAFNIGGENIQIDTTAFENVDFMKYIDIARQFMAV